MNKDRLPIGTEYVIGLPLGLAMWAVILFAGLWLAGCVNVSHKKVCIAQDIKTRQCVKWGIE